MSNGHQSTERLLLVMIMRVLQPVPLILSLLILQGCAVGPNYTRPAIDAPATFMGKRVVEARVAPVEQSASWWSRFGDPVLTRLVTQALDQNLDVAQSVARVAQARASLRSADAALLPSGTISADASTYHQSLESTTGRLLATVPNAPRNGELYEANLGASWEIDLFGGSRRGRESARADYEASVAGVAAARLSVAAQVADTYIVIRGLQARIAVADEQIVTQHRLVAIVQLQYEKGVAAELQLRQAEGVLSQVASTVPVLQTGLDAAMNALDVLIGKQPGTYRALLGVASPIPAAPAITDMGTPADLLRRRPDLIIAERKLASSNARIGVAISEYYPKFSLSGLLGTATTAAGGLFSGAANQSQGVFGLSWRLFDFGRVDAEIASARGQNAEALAAYRLAVLRASEDVEDAFSALLKREEQDRILASGETSLARAQQSSLAAYKGGVVSLIEVLDADTRLLTTRDARAQAQTEVARAAVSSFRALGGGWQSNATALSVGPADKTLASAIP
jgi:NodT family efflux transporter outer membrane factor (OMF) lipoprotein